MAKLSNFRIVKQSKDDNSFHLAIAPVLIIAQIFGLLPISGVFSSKIHNIKFKIFSFQALFSIFWLICVIIFLWLEGLRLSKNESINAKSIGGITFTTLQILTSIIFIQIASKWNDLLYLFKEVDEIFGKNPYQLPGWSLRKRIKFTTFTFLFFAFVEHLFSWASYLYDRFYQADVCGWKIESWYFYITSLHLSHVYLVFPLTYLTTLWAEYLNFSMAFAWNFVDLFIIIMSISIAAKFKMLNNRMKYFKGRIVADVFWDEMRCHYNKICELNEFIDSMLGSLICLACFSDLYYVCLQLLNVATPLPFFVNKIYYWYSTAYLIGRTCTMFLVSSSVNDESMKPMVIFRSIPTSGWFQEVQRFCNQIQHNRTALSGKNFFYLTRGILVSIAGTILTYELVLLQFDGEKIVSGMFNPCGDRGNLTGQNNAT